MSVSLFCYIFWQSKLYEDFGLHIVYVILGFYGWYSWFFGGQQKDKLKISFSSGKELMFWGVVSVVGILGLATAGWFNWKRLHQQIQS